MSAKADRKEKVMVKIARREFLALIPASALIALVGCSKDDEEFPAKAGSSEKDSSSAESEPADEGSSTTDDEVEEAKDDPEHVDEFTIVDARTQPDAGTDEYYEIILTVRNNTDETKLFQGVSVNELDASGNVIDSFMSYNKNAVEANVDPGQQIDVSLTTAKSDGVAGISSDGYEYGDPSDMTGGEFSQRFTKMF